MKSCRACTKGMTLVETLVAIFIAAALLVAASQAFIAVVSRAADEGVYTDLGRDYPLAPSRSQETFAHGLLGQVRDDFLGADWLALADRPEVENFGTLIERISTDEVALPDPAVLASPATFRSQMETADGVIFAGDNGYSVFGFRGRGEVVGILSVSWSDAGGYRRYKVWYRRGNSNSPMLAYAFAEPLFTAGTASVQLDPVASIDASTQVPVLILSLPDPSCPLAKNLGALGRAGFSGSTMTSAAANLRRASTLRLALPVAR